jgi:molecular chaperone DnaK
MKGDNLDEIKNLTKELSDASTPLAQRMYAEAQASQQNAGAAGAGAGAGAGKGKSDDAVDAEFEEVKDDK